MEHTEASLKTKKNSELVEICRAAKLPISGTKAVLIARILGTPIPTTAPKTKKKKKYEHSEPAVFNKVRECCPTIILLRNENGDFEHKETGFIFDETTKLVIGKKGKQGIVNITISDVQTCKELGFRVEDSKVDKEFTAEKANRLNELEKYMEEYNSEDDSEEEI